MGHKSYECPNPTSTAAVLNAADVNHVHIGNDGTVLMMMMMMMMMTAIL